MNIHHTIALLGAAALLTACPPGLTHLTDTDPGNACFPDGLAEDDTLDVTITNTCYSGSTENMVMSCEVAVVGDVVTISSTADYDLPPAVTADCQNVETSCSSEPLPAGNYTIRYGDSEEAFDVPDTMGDGSDFCVGPF